MKIGVLTAAWSEEPLGKVLDWLAEMGVQAVEIGTGGYPGNGHCNVDKMLASADTRKTFMGGIKDRGMILSALSCHGNPLHPDASVAQEHHEVYRKTVQLAVELGVSRVITFSGCPGDSDNAAAPNWVTCPWPPDFSDLLKWQWEEKVVPYWTEENGFADKHGVDICFEMHPGFVAYNPETLLKLRAACGNRMCCNFDPSHLWWQGIDPVEAIRLIGGHVIKHVHAKDVRLDPGNCARNGVLDTKRYGDEINRSWVFRTIGYGHPAVVWNDIVSMLRLIGYDWVLSIEHEDSLMSPGEGLSKAVQFLKYCMIAEPRGKMTWA